MAAGVDPVAAGPACLSMQWILVASNTIIVMHGVGILIANATRICCVVLHPTGASEPHKGEPLGQCGAPSNHSHVEGRLLARVLDYHYGLIEKRM